MYKIQDTMFALILRFIGRREEVQLCNQEFIQKQFKTIKNYIAKYPPEEQEMRAIEWIEMYARKYRKTWEKESAAQEVSESRCEDCPLAKPEVLGHCDIHDQWLDLLQHYTAEDMTSKEYIENTLRLLGKHKEDLKVKLSQLKNK